MSEELKKFTERWKTATKGLDAVTLDAAEGAKERCRQAWTLAMNGYGALNDDVLAAVEAGVTGTSIEDFAKHSGVRSTLQSIKGIMADQLNAANEFNAIRVKAASALPALEALSADIGKDLAKRREKSKSKADIEKLQKEVDGYVSDLKKIGKIAALKPAHADPSLDYRSEVAAILKRSKDELKDERDSVMLPQQIETKNIARNVREAVGFARSAAAACDAAIAAAGAGDKAKALGGVKEARDAIAKIATMNEMYARIATKHRIDIDNSKDKATIEDGIDKVGKALAAAEAKMKAAVAAVRGATWSEA